MSEVLQVTITGLTPGDDWRIEIPVDGLAPAPGDAGESHWRWPASAVTPTLTFSTTSGTMALAAGMITLIAPRSATESLPPGALDFDIRLDLAGWRNTPIAGRAYIRRGLTR